jgi:hypothetical protein
MKNKHEEVARTRVVGRISRSPETTRTSGGLPICRLVVAKKSVGPSSPPVQVGLYVKGDLALRCGRGLREGYLIEAFGDLGAPRRNARFPELMADKVRLFEREAPAT